MTTPTNVSKAPCSPVQKATVGQSAASVEGIEPLNIAIRGQNDRLLTNLLNTIKPTPETFKALLTQEGVLLSDPILHVLVSYAEQAQGGHLEVVLQHAIDTHNISLAQQALRKKANSHNMVIAYASNEMADLITKARKDADPYLSADSKGASLQTGSIPSDQDWPDDELEMLTELFADSPVPPRKSEEPETPEPQVLNDRSASGTFPPDDAAPADTGATPAANLAQEFYDWALKLDGLQPDYAAPADTGATPAANLEVRLQQLGYTTRQVEKINPGSRQEVITWHRALRDHDYTHSQIIKLSEQPLSLIFLANYSRYLRLALPNANVDDIVFIAGRPFGNTVLDALLEVANNLHKDQAILNETSLRFNTEDLLTIARISYGHALRKLCSLRVILSREPYNLTPAEALAIASYQDGRKRLEEFHNLFPVLIRAPYCLTREQVLAIAPLPEGRKRLKWVMEHLLLLTQAPRTLTREQVVTLVTQSSIRELEKM